MPSSLAQTRALPSFVLFGGATSSTPPIGSGRRRQAYQAWISMLEIHSLADLPAKVEAAVGVPASQVAFWSVYYGWSEHVINDQGGVVTNGGLSDLAVDSSDIDYADFAYDPLESFYEQFRTRSGSRRHITAFYAEAGFASPCEADLDLYRHLVERYPISASDAALAIGQDPSVFVKYAAIHGISANRKLERIAVPLGALVHRDTHLAAIVSKCAAHVYTTRATPVRTLALRLGLRWDDLWTMGARYSEWALPSPATLESIAEVFEDYPI